MNLPENRRVLAFMAHPDDAEFQCAGTLIRLADAGWEIHIATCAPGDCGTTSETKWSIGGIRTKEAEKAAAMVGGTYHCLDERDGLVVYDKVTIQKATDLFRRVAPSLAIIPPQKDYMMDHEMTSLLGRGASFLYGAPNASEFPVREGSCVPWLYYCDALEGIDPYGNPVQPTTYIDITDQLEKKAEMLGCHASQREWLRAHHGTDEYIDSMRRRAAERGKEAGLPAAEGFVQHRGHSYPKTDLLKELFG